MPHRPMPRCEADRWIHSYKCPKAATRVTPLRLMYDTRIDPATNGPRTLLRLRLCAHHFESIASGWREMSQEEVDDARAAIKRDEEYLRERS